MLQDIKFFLQKHRMEADSGSYFYNACKMRENLRQSSPKLEILHKIASEHQSS